jgi:hypothetical protein
VVGALVVEQIFAEAVAAEALAHRLHLPALIILVVMELMEEVEAAAQVVAPAALVAPASFLSMHKGLI